jgi:hypothetical protein
MTNELPHTSDHRADLSILLTKTKAHSFPDPIGQGQWEAAWKENPGRQGLFGWLQAGLSPKEYAFVCRLADRLPRVPKWKRHIVQRGAADYAAGCRFPHGWPSRPRRSRSLPTERQMRRAARATSASLGGATSRKVIWPCLSAT